MNNNKKILVANLLVAIMAIASIITLCVGNFFAVKITLNINETLLNTFTEGKNISLGDDTNIDLKEVFADVDIKIPISFELKGALLLGSLTGDSSEIVQKFLKTQIDSLLINLFATVDQMVSALSSVFINTVVEKAKEEVFNQLKESLGTENITDEQISAELESQYGIKQSDIDALKTDMSDTLVALVNGGAGDASQTLVESQTLDKLISVYAEQALKEELGEGSYTQEQIDAKKTQLKDEITEQLDKTIDEIAIDDKFNKESVVVWALNGLDENNHLQSIEEAKTYLANKMVGAMDDNALNSVHMALKGLGAFLLLVIVGWAYLLLKLLFKLFTRNKTVGMFVPKLLGWLPYVIFVGIPNLLFRSLNTIATKYADKLQLDAATIENFKQYANFITIKFSALTWVSALSVLILMVLWFPYRKWRKEAKRNK